MAHAVFALEEANLVGLREASGWHVPRNPHREHGVATKGFIAPLASRNAAKPSATASSGIGIEIESRRRGTPFTRKGTAGQPDHFGGSALTSPMPSQATITLITREYWAKLRGTDMWRSPKRNNPAKQKRLAELRLRWSTRPDSRASKLRLLAKRLPSRAWPRTHRKHCFRYRVVACGSSYELLAHRSQFALTLARRCLG